ncbi:MAG: OmpA family protein [Bacteroidales bacterium]|jgi:outer membrane protein OmpA-like peptidoglycan-associated protein|nr:OmpA family protein [Bacteroidales bacterium]
MKKFIAYFLLLFAGIIPLIAQDDAEGSKDPVLFTRMPGYYISRCDDIQFDRFEFTVGPGKTQAVEGHSLFYIYWIKENAQPASPLQITRNYTNAIKNIGGQLVYQFEDGGAQYVILKLVKGGKETWAQMEAVTNSYTLNIIEKEAMSQDVVADASSMANSIRESGKVAVYGIYFDTGKSVLKPESQPTLEQISKLLKEDANLKLYVVGHTDNTGVFDANIKLSMERATSVVNALVSEFSVSSSLLKACGNGPTSPVATNDTEEGRALNRRVELVKQ